MKNSISLLIFSLFFISNTFVQTTSDCSKFFKSPILQQNLEINKKYVERLKKLQEENKLEVYYKFDGGMFSQDIEFISGVPKHVEFIQGKDLGVVRHYSPHADQIKESGKLIAGPRPYIDPDAHLRKEYDDLTGIFFTTTDFDPKDLWLGFDSSTPYVDFTIPDDMIVLKLSPGNYLIPGPSKKPDWLIKEYKLFKETGVIPSHLGIAGKRKYDLFDREGILPPLEIPIKLQ